MLLVHTHAGLIGRDVMLGMPTQGLDAKGHLLWALTMMTFYSQRAMLRPGPHLLPLQLPGSMCRGSTMVAVHPRVSRQAVRAPLPKEAPLPVQGLQAQRAPPQGLQAGCAAAHPDRDGGGAHLQTLPGGQAAQRLCWQAARCPCRRGRADRPAGSAADAALGQM